MVADCWTLKNIDLSATHQYFLSCSMIASSVLKKKIFKLSMPDTHEYFGPKRLKSVEEN
jgi:hypothetical protein